MSYTPPAITSTGMTIPTYSDILDYLVAQAQQIYGADIYLGTDSADYQMLSIQAKMIYDSFLTAQAAYNSRSPVSALGAGLDGIVAINGLIRKAATASTASVELQGTANTSITGGIVSDSNGYQWTLPTPLVLNSSGSLTVTATCQTLGPITAPAGTITGIVTPVTGWSSVTNPSAANVGNAVETDSQLRARQAKSTAQPSQGRLEALEGALVALAGATRVKVYENDTSSADSNNLPGHSVTCVVGGTASSKTVAQTIFNYKGLGVLANGSTQETVTDQYGNSLTIGFEVPFALLIDVTVQVVKLAGYTTDTATAIQQAVASYLNNFSIGISPYISGLWGAALSADPTPTNPAFSVTQVSAAIDSGGLTLASALTSGTAYTSLPTTALTVPIPSGTSLTLGSGSTTQTVTTSASAAIGDTAIAVSSFTANADYASGTAVSFTPVTSGSLPVAYNQVVSGNASNVTLTT